MKLGEEARAVPLEVLAQAIVKLALRTVGRGLVQQPEIVGQVEGEAAVALAERRQAHANHLARRAQRVEVAGPIPRQPRGQDVAFESGGGERRALQLLDDVQERVRAKAPRGRGEPGSDHHALPVENRTRQRFGLRGRHLSAQLGERALAQRGQDVGAHPFAPRAPGPELTFDYAAKAEEFAQGRFDGRGATPEPPRHVRRREGPVCARVTGDEVAQCVRHRLQEGQGQTPRRLDPEAVAQPRRVLGGRVALLPRQAYADDATLGDEGVEPFAGLSEAGVRSEMIRAPDPARTPGRAPRSPRG